MPGGDRRLGRGRRQLVHNYCYQGYAKKKIRHLIFFKRPRQGVYIPKPSTALSQNIMKVLINYSCEKRHYILVRSGKQCEKTSKKEIIRKREPMENNLMYLLR